MAVVLNRLNGMSREIVARLKAQGIKNSRDLLGACRTPAARRELAERIGMDPTHLLVLAHRADMARIRNIGGVYGRLLEEAGVSTVGELARRSPERLRAELNAINAEKRMAGRVPAQAMVNGWVSKARNLPQAVEY